MSDADKQLADLIGRVSLRDRQAFDALYAETSSKLFGVALRLLKNRADAEEALQEVYIRIWQKAESHARSGAPAMGWLVTIARNHAIDRLRSRKQPADDIDEAYDLADKGPTPEAAMLATDERQQIDGCLDELDDDKADAVRSVYLDGFSYQELADRNAVPLNTMRTWLRRSLMKLKDCLER